MARPKKIVKQSRQTYSDEYRAEALKLADNVGVTAAANKLGIQTSQIYSWRGKSRLAESRTESERKLLAENAKLKRQLSEQEEELAICELTASVHNF